MKEKINIEEKFPFPLLQLRSEPENFKVQAKKTREMKKKIFGYFLILILYGKYLIKVL